MLPFLSTPPQIVSEDILAKVREMLLTSVDGDVVYLVTPYIKFDKKIRESIKNAVDRRVQVKLLVRKGAERIPDDSRFLADSGVAVYEHEFLHAKVYCAERMAIVGSINLHTFSDQMSREIAVIFSDKANVRQIRSLVEDWMRNSSLLPPSVLLSAMTRAGQKVSESRVASGGNGQSTSTGFCIRCGGAKRAFNPNYPYCDPCFTEWTREKKSAPYAEKHCHRCGKKEKTDKTHPLCRECWEAMGKPSFAASL